MGEYKVSIIIPVYNGAQYLEEAVRSASILPETGEILIVEDGSTDNSWDVCKLIEMKNPLVRTFRHPGGGNLGAAASRNIGIINAKFDYIAFLDADDYYLPNRFKKEKEIFLTDSTIDGVYGCNIAKFENDEARKKFLKRYSGELTTMSKVIPPEKLFKVLLYGGCGYFHTSAITLHKSAFAKTGMFNTNIRYVEDTELWLRLSLLTRLVHGSIEEPISIRRVHDTNSIHQINKVEEFRSKMYQSLFSWALHESFDFETKNDFFITLHQSTCQNATAVKKTFWHQVSRNPFLLISTFGIKKIHQLYFTY